MRPAKNIRILEPATALALGLVLVLALAGCGGSGATTSSSAQTHSKSRKLTPGGGKGATHPPVAARTVKKQRRTAL